MRGTDRESETGTITRRSKEKTCAVSMLGLIESERFSETTVGKRGPSAVATHVPRTFPTRCTTPPFEL